MHTRLYFQTIQPPSLNDWRLLSDGRRGQNMSESGSLVNLVLRAVALAMGVAVVVLNIIGAADADTLVTLLGIGLFSLALDALNRGKE